MRAYLQIQISALGQERASNERVTAVARLVFFLLPDGEVVDEDTKEGEEP